MEFKITIGRVYSSVRDTSGRLFYPNLNTSLHWSARSLWVSAFKREAWVLAVSEKNRRGLKTFARAKITVVYYTCQPKDLDNAYGSAKPLIDGIVAAGIIPDDSDQYLDLQVRSVKVAHRVNQRTEIIIEKLK